MSDFVTAWNKETGRQYPFPVPRHWINHPTLRPSLSDAPPEPAPAPSGDNASPVGAELIPASSPAAVTETEGEI